MPPPLRGVSTLISRCPRFRSVRVHLPTEWIRCLQISTRPTDALDISPSTGSSGVTPDAKFEVSGSPFSLLSISLSASQNLYTRRGTLVGVGGKAENAVSTLSMLEPFTRAFLRIPFLYQRISSTTPVTALISTKASNTSITVVHLDGSIDWTLAGKALLAWTGHTLRVTPTLNRKMSLAHWGNSEITGRGLLALAGQGSISQLVLKDGEAFLVHPSNVIAYPANRTPPLPYRLKSSSLRLQIPNISNILPDTRFTKVVRESRIWQTMTRLSFDIRTWATRTIWGDRLFLQFHGPTTVLMQTRASRISDILTSRDINEIADTQPGTQPLVTLSATKGGNESPGRVQVAKPVTSKAPQMQTASIGSDGKVTFVAAGASKV